MNEHVKESFSRSILHAMRSGNGFNNKIMGTGNGLNKVIMYILPSKQKREILFEAVRTCVCLKLDVCSMCVTIATKPWSKWLNEVKKFAKVNGAFTIFLHWRHDRFIVYKFNTVSLFSNQDSKVTKHTCISSLLSSSSPVTSPSSMTRLDSAEWSN